MMATLVSLEGAPIEFRGNEPAAGAQGESETPAKGRRGWLAIRKPLLAILLLAPWFGEAVTQSTPALDLLLPWNLAFMVALYGSGALICREIARRYNMGLAGLVFLGAAYGVWEEALVDRYWFKPAFWADMEVGRYSVVWETNLLIATHLTIFHASVSVCASVLVVEHLFPQAQTHPWIGTRGLIVAGFVLGLAVPIVYGEFDQLPSFWVLLAAAALCATLAGAAFLMPQRRVTAPPQMLKRRHRGLVSIVFVCASAHILSVWWVAQTPNPWPLGIAITVVPVVLAILLVSRRGRGGPYGTDAILVIIGMLSYHLLIGTVVGLAGRVDITLGALLTWAGLIGLYRRDRAREAQSLLA